ncbi:MAG: acyl-CoA thioesterase [Pseudomonas umsongensis]|nr:acyl-CoA thioesterase [Pseudomonas umsongensis]
MLIFQRVSVGQCANGNTGYRRSRIELWPGVCQYTVHHSARRSGVHMNFHTRKWVKPEDLNPNGTLFGGSRLRWLDEEAAIYAIVQLGNQRVVTKYISEINFVSASRQGDIIELGITATEFGRTSITLTCEVRNKITRKSILTVEKIVFVNLGEDGLPAPHGRTEIKYVKDQFKDEGAVE